MERKQEKRFGYFRQRVRIILDNKKWWLTPLLAVLLLGIYVILYLAKYQQTRFIYTLF